jgi:hypothetical protein
VKATTGTTGPGLAPAAIHKGYRLILAIFDNMNQEDHTSEVEGMNDFEDLAANCRRHWINVVRIENKKPAIAGFLFCSRNSSLFGARFFQQLGDFPSLGF